MKIRNTLIAFLFGVLIALPLKIYQLLTRVDFETGFAKSSGAVEIILPVVLVLCVAVCFVLAYTSKKHPQFSPNVKSVPMGLISGVLALAVGWNSASDLLDAENAAFSGSAGIIYSCIGLICVLAFLFAAVSFFMGNNLIASRPVIMLLPVIWMGLRMVLTFLQFTTKANINESLYDLLVMVFMLIFLLATAKFLSGSAENSSKLLFASGSAAALFAALATIPRFILKFSGNEEFEQLTETVKSAYQPCFADFMLMLFAVGMMFYASIPVKQRALSRAGMPGQPRMDNRQPAMGQQQRMPYGQPGMNGQMRPYMPSQPRRPVMQRPLPGAGPDAYTTRGAGMRVAEDFLSVGSISSGTKYGGIDSFRDDMLSGRRALEVLESSMTVGRTYDEYEGESMIMMPTFTAGDIAEITEQDETSAELEELGEEVTASLSSLFAQRENSVRAPKEASVIGASDEAAEEIPEDDEEELPPPQRRSVALGSGRRGGRLADRLNEMEERRGGRRERPRTPIGRVPYNEYDRYGMYDGEYYDEPEEEYEEYEEFESYGERGYYDEYYDESDYGPSDYEEYDDDDYDDDYDDYDDYDDDEYDDDDDYDDGYGYDYDDEGYGAPQGGYNYW